jgi:hypothetical protein
VSSLITGSTDPDQSFERSLKPVRGAMEDIQSKSPRAGS